MIAKIGSFFKDNNFDPYFQSIWLKIKCYNIVCSVFLISSYGTPLAQRNSYLALHSFLFGPVAQLIMSILSLTALSLR